VLPLVFEEEEAVAQKFPILPEPSPTRSNVDAGSEFDRTTRTKETTEVTDPPFPLPENGLPDCTPEALLSALESELLVQAVPQNSKAAIAPNAMHAVRTFLPLFKKEIAAKGVQILKKSLRNIGLNPDTPLAAV
jgi:hypothetical protein